MRGRGRGCRRVLAEFHRSPAGYHTSASSSDALSFQSRRPALEARSTVPRWEGASRILARPLSALRLRGVPVRGHPTPPGSLRPTPLSIASRGTSARREGAGRVSARPSRPPSAPRVPVPGLPRKLQPAAEPAPLVWSEGRRRAPRRRALPRGEERSSWRRSTCSSPTSTKRRPLRHPAPREAERRRGCRSRRAPRRRVRAFRVGGRRRRAWPHPSREPRPGRSPSKSRDGRSVTPRPTPSRQGRGDRARWLPERRSHDA
jgi:hypothetical protein